MGNADRIVRLIVAAIFAVLYFTNTVSGTFRNYPLGFRRRFCINQPHQLLSAVCTIWLFNLQSWKNNPKDCKT
jgi:hypothetical protein